MCATSLAYADDEELRTQVRQLTGEVQQLRSELKEMDARTEALAAQQEAGLTAAPATNPVSIFGYGEVNYNRPVHDNSETRMDLRRAVFGFGYRFDDQTRFNSEFEIEHAVASADDEGEVEVEQFYVDHSLVAAANLKAGLFLIPMGLLNESHEPVYYYGVERNFVETIIIPSTWREGGVGLYGSTSRGFAWDVGVTTGFDLGKWDPASSEGQESPLGSIHQELQKARAHDLSTYLALSYRGIPGWVAGASVFTGKVAQGNPDVGAASDARSTLWEAHTRWTAGNVDLSALYARGTISDTRDLNANFVAVSADSILVPEAFWGWYTQAAYKFHINDRREVSPFIRYERFNTGSSYAEIPAGLTPAALPTESVWTYGVNFYLNPKVVFKADYQTFKEDSDRDRFDLGLGLMF
jgi:phosphate-selective porin